MSYLTPLVDYALLRMNTKAVLTLDTVKGWAKETLPEGGILVVERQLDGKAWIITANAHHGAFKRKLVENWRAETLDDDLLNLMRDLPVIAVPIPKSA